MGLDLTGTREFGPVCPGSSVWPWPLDTQGSQHRHEKREEEEVEEDEEEEVEEEDEEEEEEEEEWDIGLVLRPGSAENCNPLWRQTELWD